MRRMTKVMNLLNTVPAQCPATPPLYKLFVLVQTV